MSDTNWFEVTFYRVNESAHKAPSETHKAHSLKLTPDGQLTIQWDGGGTSMTGGSYDSLEVKRFRMPTRDR
jgi:hypothetical protein